MVLQTEVFVLSLLFKALHFYTLQVSYLHMLETLDANLFALKTASRVYPWPKSVSLKVGQVLKGRMNALREKGHDNTKDKKFSTPYRILCEGYCCFQSTDITVQVPLSFLQILSDLSFHTYLESRHNPQGVFTKLKYIKAMCYKELWSHQTLNH